MTTQEEALAQLFGARSALIPLINKGSRTKPTRRRVKPIYCPRCASWVEVLLQPVRLHCTGCGLEARP